MGRITAASEAIGRAGNRLFIGAAVRFTVGIACRILQCPVQDELSGLVVGHDIGLGTPIPLRRFAELGMGETEIQIGAVRQAGDRYGAPEFIDAPGALRFLECAAGNCAHRSAVDAALTQFKGGIIRVFPAHIHGAAEADGGRSGRDLQGKFHVADGVIMQRRIIGIGDGKIVECRNIVLIRALKKDAILPGFQRAVIIHCQMINGNIFLVCVLADTDLAGQCE